MPNISSADSEQVSLLGIGIDALTEEQLNGEINNIIEMSNHALVLNVNVHALNLSFCIDDLRDFFRSARVVFCDGAGVILGARLLGYNLPQRITYADWIWLLAEYAQSRGFTFFFLGARPGVADKAALNLLSCLPNLNIVGTHHGYFDKTFGSAENEVVIEKINAVKPNILIVGFGMPLQERWLMENWDRIDANVALTGGAVFDYVSGELQRAPRWMTENGLEWLGRLLIEPRRLWRRYLIGNPLFLWRVLKQRLGLLHFEEE